MKSCVVRGARCAVFLTLIVACNRPERIPPSVRYANHVAAAGSEPPAGDLSNPFVRDAASVSDGSKIFSAMNCDGCHGAGATGWVGPSLVDGRWRYGETDGALYQSIFYGRPRGMPAYGGVMSPGAIWKVVTYLRAQSPPSDVPTERFTEPGQPKPAREQAPGH